MRPWIGALAGVAALSVVSLFVGVIEVSPRDLLRDTEALKLIVISRAPRLFAVLITGASLAICGAIMQMLVRNRFVEPMTAGSGQGAILGVVLAVMIAPAAPVLMKMSLAAITALLTSLGFLAIVRRLPPTQPLLVALVGLVYGASIAAATTFFAYQADLMQYIEISLHGDFSAILQGRYEILWLAALVTALAYLAADQFAIAGLGRSASISLGLNYGQVMILGLVAISAVAALTVVTVGLLPFVGLVAPNIISRRYGDNLRATLPLTALLGAGLVLISDVIGRLVRHPFEIPVGAVLGIIGAALFLWLLYRPLRHAG